MRPCDRSEGKIRGPCEQRVKNMFREQTAPNLISRTLFFLATDRGGAELNFQAQHADELFFQALQFLFPRVLFAGAVVEGFLEELQILPEFHLPESQAAQGPQGFLLLGVQFARLPVNDTQSAQGKAVFIDDGRTRIKADVGLAQDHGIVFEAGVLHGVGNDEEVLLLDGMSAKRSVFWSFTDLDTDSRFE